MGNVIYHQPKGSRTRKIVDLYGQFTTTTLGTIDSAGSALCDGFAVSKIGTGAYRATLDESYEGFIGVDATALIATWVAAKGGPRARPKAISLVNRQVDFEFTNDLGAAAEVPDGSVVHVYITMRDSTLRK